jgi:hypothetical protein
MSNLDVATALDAMSARIMALEALLYAVTDAIPDRAALRTTFAVYAAGTEAKMNGLPVGDHYLELLRVSLDDMRAVIDRRKG